MVKRFLSTGNVERAGSTSSPTRAFRRLVLAWGAMVFTATILLYTPALQNGFVNWDDYAYVFENTHIHTLSMSAFYWMLTAFYATNWHPLTWLSHGVDCACFGLGPSGHHLTSIMLHGLNTLLVFLLGIQLVLRTEAEPKRACTGNLPVRALITGVLTALLFGVHPIHVESVAWVAERKDVLCGFFFLSALCAYLFYTSAAGPMGRRMWYAACLLLTGGALTAKPMAVTLPLVLLILDVYPLRRISLCREVRLRVPVLLEKIPFFILSAVSGILTVLAQHGGGAFETLERLPLLFRLVNALHSPFFYLTKMAWPGNLVPFYPFPRTIHSSDLTYYVISGLFILCVTGVCLWFMKRGRYVLCAAWTYYLVTLFPVLGIILVGSQAAADRYVYLPSAGIFLLAGSGAAQVLAGRAFSRKRVLCGGLIAALVLAALGRMTMQQITVWRDSETLWMHVIKHFPGRVPIAHNNLGVLYDRRGMYHKAVEEYEKAIAINPTFADAYSNLGLSYDRRGMYDKAVHAYERALALNPTLLEARNNLGLAYHAQGRYDKAVDAYERVLAINPALAETCYNLGLAYHAQGRYDKAVDAYERALAINPALTDAHCKLALAHFNNKNYKQARAHLRQGREHGCKIDPAWETLINQGPSS